MESFNPVFFGNTDLMNLIWFAFLIFFAGLVFYLQRESRREGYPLESDTTGEVQATGMFYFPPEKTYVLASGETIVNPSAERDNRPIAARAVDPNPGAPLEPTGDPMADGVGPAAYAERADHPDVAHDGRPKLMPMRAVPEFDIAPGDSDPRGMTALGADRATGGKVVDAWVDRGEAMLRYYEVETASGRRVLIPVPLADVNGKRGTVTVRALLGSQFEGIPTTRSGDEVTMLEEDKISAYVGSGYLFATPQRREPLI